ncbi:short-chain dehydrogenase [Marasmius fiardii PR-910]|nr:short-chain dehydrogenase [Marasmius fiardii PR-910]
MPAPVEGVSLDGEVVIVTGANTGIGYEAAKHFAIRGPKKLIMMSRSEARGMPSVERLKKETGFQNVELWTMDYSSFESVKATKEKIDALDRLDILVENAALTSYDYEVTKDGWENVLQVNHFSFGLHAMYHIPKMLETAKRFGVNPRLVLVSSDTHYWTTICDEAIEAPNTLEFLTTKEYSLRDGIMGDQRYMESKILATMFIRQLQAHLPASSPTVTCCAVNPGFCLSELRRSAPGEYAEDYKKMEDELAFTAEEGSRQLLYAAIGQRDREEEVRGGYVSFMKVTECSDFILGEVGQKLEKKVWDETLDVLGKVDSRIEELVEKYLS